ncbi:UNVERIFIED_CONTAM: PP2A regulatory subunit TAP46 [Sesamum angustifolium]|uniref:PP2A regulatory subunit TAP46 n=1 Tax=Sesamum angustifolium TaxID=2727405 RepID=A0AAW2LIK5_9LAMI
MSLPVLFEQARKIHQAASDSSVDQDTVKKGCELLKKSEEMIGKLGLFSANETKEDISTTNLKYLLVPYYLGELTEKIAEEDRIRILKASQAKLKIARFKRQKAAESKLLEIKERKERRGRSTRASALSTPVETGKRIRRMMTEKRKGRHG